MAEFLMLGLVVGVAFIFILLKLPQRKVAGGGLSLDIIITATLAIIFMGTFAGMAVGIVGGAVVSIYLYITKIAVGNKAEPLVDVSGLKNIFKTEPEKEPEIEIVEHPSVPESDELEYWYKYMFEQLDRKQMCRYPDGFSRKEIKEFLFTKGVMCAFYKNQLVGYAQ
jgi:hypothetical protein